MVVCVCECSVTSDSVTVWTVTCQALLSMEYSRQEYWSWMLFLLQGILPTKGLNLCLLLLLDPYHCATKSSKARV